MSSLSRIAEALEKLIEEEVPQYDPYRNERRIADALERIARVLECRLPWGANIYTPQTFPIQNPIPYSPYTNPTVISNGNAIGPTPEPPITQYTPPTVSYPDYSEPKIFSCGVQSENDIPF